ncbi:MAG TPA: FG-GAP-like repeat-containing protein [Candidatus Latescibacteria bacterium]|nr:FG-GAP-like repeat-containing protein [Candidatus Latescibacterota bacterium]
MTCLRIVRSLVVYAFLATIVASCAGTITPEEKEHAARLFSAGCGLMAESHFAGAQVLFDSARALDPTESCYWVAAGQARMNQANYDTANALFEKAVEIDSTRREAWFAIGFLALRQARNEDAIRALERCLDDAAALYLAGTAYARMDRYADAERLYARSVEVDPQFISAYYAYGQLLQRLGKDRDARPLLERFSYLRDNGGTSIDLGGDIGTHKQGRMADIPVPERFFFTPDVGASPMKITASSVRFAGRLSVSPGKWVAARACDLDGDGADELLAASEDAVRVWRIAAEDSGFVCSDITPQFSFPGISGTGGRIRDLALGDVGRDGFKDVLIVREKRSTLWVRDPSSNRFVLLRDDLPGAMTGILTDLDHDSYLDIVLGTGTASSPQIIFLRNTGASTFSDNTDSSGLRAETLESHFRGRGPVASIRAADLDRDWDTDLLVTFAAGEPVVLKNQHDGRFGRVADSLDAVSLPRSTVGEHVFWSEVGDVVGDGWLDVVIAGTKGVISITPARAGQAIQISPNVAPSLYSGLGMMELQDIDLDGDLDVLASGFSEETGVFLKVFENRGDGKNWTPVDVPTPATRVPEGRVVGLEPFCFGKPEQLAVLALSGTGVPVVVRAAPRGKLIRMVLDGGRSSRDGLGAVVDVAQGSHWQRRVLSDGGAGQSGCMLAIGLREDTPVDLVRVTWTSGIRQSVPDTALSDADCRLVVVEKPGETSSCPFVYTWNGREFEFIADALGGGVIGVVTVPPSTYHQPDPDEYIRIRGDQLKPQNGKLRLRVAEVLNEASIIDQLALYAVRHFPGEEVYTTERMNMVEPPPTFGIWRIRNAHPIRSARTDMGGDATALLESLDRRYVHPGKQLPYAGFGVPHTLELDLGDQPLGKPIVLLMDGWTSFWNSTSIAEAARDGVGFIPMRIDVREGDNWRTIVPDMGIPAGKPKTIVTDLTGKVPRGSSRIRLVTNMLVFWDRARVSNDATLVPTNEGMERLPLVSSELQYLGYPKAVSPDGIEPYTYVYADCGQKSPWGTLPGYFTRYGDVGQLLSAADDRYVVMNHGDEIALEFRAGNDRRAGSETDYFLFLFGYMKEMVARDSLLSQLEPLPFRGMSYPYSGASPVAQDEDYRAYRAAYQTRRLGHAN